MGSSEQAHPLKRQLRSFGRAVLRRSGVAIVGVVLLLTGFGVARADTDSTPPNDASFWLQLNFEGRSTPFEPLPSGVGPDERTTGVAVHEGAVVDQPDERLGEGAEFCSWPQYAASCHHRTSVRGGYADGRIEIVWRKDTTTVYDGRYPFDAPTEPGTFDTLTEFSITGDWLIAEGRFEGEGVLTQMPGQDNVCARWKDNDVGGTCTLTRFVPLAAETETFVWRGWIRGDYTGGPGQSAPPDGAGDGAAEPGSEALTVEVLALTGEVSYIPAGSESARSLTGDVVLQPGDTILTGFDSGGSFRIGQNRLDLPPATAIRIDEYLADGNIERTRLFINVGAVRANMRHTSSIRSDFSVQTPTSNSSARGTEFIVAVGEDGASTTYVLDGTVSVRGAEGEAMDVAAGNKAFVAPAAAIVGPEPYEPAELPAFPDGQVAGGSSLSPVAVGGIALAVVLVFGAAAAVSLQRRRDRASIS